MILIKKLNMNPETTYPKSRIKIPESIIKSVYVIFQIPVRIFVYRAVPDSRRKDRPDCHDSLIYRQLDFLLGIFCKSKYAY